MSPDNRCVQFALRIDQLVFMSNLTCGLLLLSDARADIDQNVFFLIIIKTKNEIVEADARPFFSKYMKAWHSSQ